MASAIEALHGTVTIVVIAHRLITLKNFDTVIYIKKGALLEKEDLMKSKGKLQILIRMQL